MIYLTIHSYSWQQIAKATGVADECLGNMRTVRAFAMEDHETELFEREVEKSRVINERLGFGIGLFQVSYIRLKFQVYQKSMLIIGIYLIF